MAATRPPATDREMPPVAADSPPHAKRERLGFYAKRTLAGREKWVALSGGTTESELAVAEGLDWLARHQAVNGFWSDHCLDPKFSECRCQKDAPCSGSGSSYEAAQTGLPLLAFQAAGHYYDNENRYSAAVRKGLDYLVAHQRSDGGLIGSQSPLPKQRFHSNYMYEHGIAAFALADACAAAKAAGQLPDPRYLAAAERAVRFIESQQHADGGWRYTDVFGMPSDSSVTGWQVLALKSAGEVGIPVAESCVAQVRKFFQTRAMGRDGRTYYIDQNPGTDAMTGVGMLARQFLLSEPEAPLVHDAAGYLARQAEKRWTFPKNRPQDIDYYLWYNCTLAMLQAGGEPWKRWNPPVRDAIVGLQQHQGCARGSWTPVNHDGAAGGRIYSTALALLTLEVYYRYTSPLERETGIIGVNATTRDEPAAPPHDRSKGAAPSSTPQEPTGNEDRKDVHGKNSRRPGS